MKKKSALIITSISRPNRILIEYAEKCREHNIDFIVIGDVGSPTSFHIENCDFFSVEAQRRLDSKLVSCLPEKHYSRKNIGYLIAMDRGVQIIIETDDDNFPLSSFWKERKATVNAHILERLGWVNIYRYFSNGSIWPRGFPLDFIKHDVPELQNLELHETYCPIQQGLADENPDVDAVFRLVCSLPQTFDKKANLAVGKESWCPFNSQNTTWFQDAFPLLYLPSTCSFRMTDIWRSFIAQRICWENNWHVLFQSPTVRQERNEHDLLKDFSDEIPGYLNNRKICESLEQVRILEGKEHIPENMLCCYEKLVQMGLIEKKELECLQAWLKDCNHLH